MAYTGKKPIDHTDVTQSQSMTVTDDLTVDTNTLYVDSTNNRVGVGVTSGLGSLLTIARNNSVGFMNAAGTASDQIIYGDSSSNLRFYTLASERMRIDSSGNVGVGRSPNYKLDAYISGSGSPAIASSNDSIVTVMQSVGTSQGNIGTLTSHPLVFIAGNTERMRIDSTGNVGIGTASPSNSTLDVAGRGRFLQDAAATTGAVIIRESSGGVGGHIQFVTNDNSGQRGFIASNSSSALLFGTAGNEAMRIDSSPQVLMGKTVANLTTAGSIQAANATSDGSPAYFYMIKTYSGTRNAWLNYHNGTYVGGINMTNTSTSFSTSSDERLKKNIVDAPSAGEKIDAMQVRSFNWKADDSFQEYGLIAQELQSVYDLPVEQHDIEDTYTVDYSKLVPVLLKEIQDLRKRVATLENN